MWKVIKEPNDISMARGDYGVQLPINMDGFTFAQNDSVRIKIKDRNTVVLAKDFTNITNSTVNLELTRAESELLSVGEYKYSLDWYQNGHFMCNIIPFAVFKVEDKV